MHAISNFNARFNALKSFTGNIGKRFSYEKMHRSNRVCHKLRTCVRSVTLNPADFALENAALILPQATHNFTSQNLLKKKLINVHAYVLEISSAAWLTSADPSA